MKGNVFDIQRFSTHDGDGLRTTVFLKGCPLSCVWCQNPEGIVKDIQPVYFKSKCIHCGICEKTATDSGITMEDGVPTIHTQRKEDWDSIVDACPSGAIRMDGKCMSVSEVMDEVMRDLVFYKHGGGVTLSGGEVLFQADFALEILKKCKKSGIHTAIETSLYGKIELIERFFPYVDMIFVDMKVFDDAQHKKYTGVSNQVIKENLRFLLTSKKKEQVVVRTPMIPGMTSSEDNIRKISKFMYQIYSEVTYEILNYNPLAQAKYHVVKRKYCFQKNPKMYTEEEMEGFRRIATEEGITKLL